MIEESIAPMLIDSTIPVTNLVADIKTIEEFENKNEIKVVLDKYNNALYFSREANSDKKKRYT